jgi:hypothetical protein
MTRNIYDYIPHSIPCFVAAAAQLRFTLHKFHFFDLVVDVHSRRPCAVHTVLEVKSLLPLSLRSPPAALR